MQRSFDGARVDAACLIYTFTIPAIAPVTALSTGGMFLALVGEILGHSDPRTTYRYINCTSDTVSDAGDILNKRQPVRIADRKRMR